MVSGVALWGRKGPEEMVLPLRCFERNGGSLEDCRERGIRTPPQPIDFRACLLRREFRYLQTKQRVRVSRAETAFPRSAPRNLCFRWRTHVPVHPRPFTQAAVSWSSEFQPDRLQQRGGRARSSQPPPSLPTQQAPPDSSWHRGRSRRTATTT